jgi:hypothetical protein
MPDRLHPDSAGQRHMGERFVALLPDLVPAVWSDAARHAVRGGSA